MVTEVACACTPGWEIQCFSGPDGSGSTGDAPAGPHWPPPVLLQVNPALRTRSLLCTPTLASFLCVHPSFPHYFLANQRKHTRVRSFTGEVRQNTEHKLLISLPHARVPARLIFLHHKTGTCDQQQPGGGRGGVRLSSCGSGWDQSAACHDPLPPLEVTVAPDSSPVAPPASVTPEDPIR